MDTKVRGDVERIQGAKPHEWVPVSKEWMDAGMPLPSEEVKQAGRELRVWFKSMVESDFSEEECRIALADAANILPLEWLQAEYEHLYSGRCNSEVEPE